MIEPVGHDKATLGEGPIWDQRDGRLFWVDIVEGAVNAFTPGTARAQRVEVGEDIGCLALTAQPGTLVGALRSGWHWIDVESGERQLIAASPADRSHRFNDGAVDDAGRFLTGTLEDGETNPVGTLFLLDTDLTYRSLDHGFLCSNGITWSVDRQWMFFVDSGRHAIYRYRYDVERGMVGDRDLFLDTSELPGFPDGIEMDSHGTLWCAFWDGAQVIGFDGSGAVQITIPVPAIRPTSLTFGGADLRTMYITSARIGLSEQELADWPASGSVFAIERPTPGLPANVFRGNPWTQAP